MTLGFNFPIRPVLAVAASIIFARAVSAQPGEGTDPFAMMRGSLGEQTQSPTQYPRLDLDPITNTYSGYDMARNLDLAQILVVPPVPPVLGEGAPGAGGAGFAPDYMREIFYGGFAAVSHLNKLSPKETERILLYRSNRQQLLDEIRAKFDELAAATPAARKAGLAELAAKQDSRLRALADDAEAIRDDLDWVNSIFRIRISLPGGGVRFVRSSLGQRQAATNFGIVRGEPPALSRLFTAAYFFAGLSTDQRFLLSEIAYEQALNAKDDASDRKDTGASGFFFLPATARIRLPARLPAALEGTIQAFAREKESLKSELSNVVLRDDYFLVATRTRRLAAFAEQQAPRLAALEALAEEIRVGLAGLATSDRPESTSLPADLTQRMGSFNARKVEVRRELLNRLRQLTMEHPADRFEIVRQGEGLAIVQTGANPVPVAGLAEFNDGQARQYAAFAAESETLRRDIQHYLDSSPQRGTRTVDQLAGDFAKAYAARENAGRDRDYARAVLEPGLSAAQRRLLFQSATTSLGPNDGSFHP